MDTSLHQKDSIDYIIVGGGCFATSTVDAVKREWRDARIVWYTGTHTHTASNDFLKIVRDAYPEKTIAEYANRAMQKWTNTGPYCDYFHKTAWIQAIDKDTKKSMNKGQNDKMVTAAEMLQLVGSTVKPILDQGEELYLNPNVGYVDSALALQALSDKVVKQGVERYQENITKLVIESGRCLGVEVGGSIIEAAKTIVCTGAWTLELLQKSNINVPPDFFGVTAVGVATLALTEAEFGILKSMPILVTEDGEIMLSQLRKVLKVTTTETFQIEHPDELGGDVDITPNRRVLEKMLPQFKGRVLERFICPDLLTPYQNPLVDEFPGIQQLILATGGSYHSAKFLTTIGDMVVLRIRGQEISDPLERTLLERWSWNRPKTTQSVHPNIVPKGFTR